VSTPILNLLRQQGYGATFKASISGNKIHFVGYSFVDDTDLIQTGPTITTSESDTLLLMQVALDLWNQGLSATGGTLVPENPFGTLSISNGEADSGVTHLCKHKLNTC